MFISLKWENYGLLELSKFMVIETLFVPPLLLNPQGILSNEKNWKNFSGPLSSIMSQLQGPPLRQAFLVTLLKQPSQPFALFHAVLRAS